MKKYIHTLALIKASLMMSCLAIATHTLAAEGDTHLYCGKLLDVKSGKLSEGMRIAIKEGVIQSITQTPAQSGDIVLTNHTCLPGLIDMHVHLENDPRPQVISLSQRLNFTATDVAIRATKLAERTLMAGFTTVRDLGASDNINLSLRKAIDDGVIPGPRIFAAGKAIATTGGHADPSNGLSHSLRESLGKPTPTQGVIDSPEQAREAVRARYQDGADLIKITATGGVLSQAANGMNAQFTDEELKAIIDTAKDYGFQVAAHAHGAEGMKRAVKAGIHSVEHGTYMDDEIIALMKKHGTWLVPTISAGRYVADKAKLPDFYSPIVRPKAAMIGAKIQATFAKAYKDGVKIAFGTDAGVFPHGENAKEFAYMVEAGMPPLTAIQCATLHATTLLNTTKKIGSIENGYLADIIAVKDNPLQNIQTLEKVVFVMKEGVVYKKP